jgi:outer membrane protein
MKKLIKISFLLIAFVAMTATVQAQKFGYVFSMGIVAEFPETKQADINLETLQKQLQKQYEGKLASAQKKAAQFQADFEAGNLSPVQQEEAQKTMAAEEKKILEFQQEIQSKIMEKRQELYQPILDKVDVAIKEVAKEEGLVMVFNADAGAQILLYADESTNMTNKVRAKLGMPPIAANN